MDLRYFGRSGGCLFVIECKDLGGVVFDIFELSRDYSKWVLKYHVDLAPLRTLYPSMVDDDLEPCCGERCKVYIPCFLNDEKENKAKLVISVLRKIILYDANDMTVKEIAEVDSGPGNAEADCWDVLYKWSDAHQHIETLAYV
ncbi:hypothetical protein ACH5RR_003417 [Cinchona calisaya]|uniref:Uncharacterized protein n=1 Tax=Cinchona calisaya TaxID=153742 RepID=A0ABD3AUS5_9GENT